MNEEETNRRDLVGSIERAFLQIAAAAVAVTFVLVIFNSSVRLIIVQGPMWPDPLTEYLVLVVTLFAAPAVLRSNGHIIVDAAINAVPFRVARFIKKCAHVIGALACGAMAFYSLRVTIEAIIAGHKEIRAISIPFAFLSGSIFLAFLMLMVGYLRKIFQPTRAGG